MRLAVYAVDFVSENESTSATSHRERCRLNRTLAEPPHQQPSQFNSPAGFEMASKASMYQRDSVSRIIRAIFTVQESPKVVVSRQHHNDVKRPASSGQCQRVYSESEAIETISSRSKPRYSVGVEPVGGRRRTFHSLQAIKDRNTSHRVSGSNSSEG